MKKIIYKLFSILLALVLLITFTNKNDTLTVEAGSSTSSTYAIDIRNHGFSITQDAYLPEKAVIGIGLTKPCDMYIDSNDTIYIVDQENRAIYIYDSVSKTTTYVLQYSEFKTPKGISMLNDETLYVADPGAGKVFVFNKQDNGEFVFEKSYGKPTSILFAENEFKPSKIAVDRSGNMFIVGDGVLDGIIQLSKSGDFLGYFSSNKVNKSLKEKMQELIYDEETLDKLGSSQPPTFSNVFVDSYGLVYSTTSYSATEDYPRVKKHNTSGKNIIEAIEVGYSPVDIYVGKNNVIYVAWSNGKISTYTEDGNILFTFGGQSINNIAGLFDSLVSLAVDSDNNIWCLDDKKAAIHEFVPTDYTKLIYEAMDLYQKRNYEESIAKWNEVLSLNQVSAIAHNQIGINYYNIKDYQKAMEHLKLAGDRTNYSQAYWEVRNIWLQSNLVFVVLGLIAIFAVLIVLKQLKVKKGIAVGGNLIAKFNDLKLVKDMKFNMSVLKRPYDSFYYIKTNKKGSTLSCVITMFVVFAIFLWYTLGKGFIFQYVTSDDVDILALIVGYFGAIFLVTLCNWLVSSIQDGEGGFLAVFRTVIVSLIPWAISMIAVCLLSYVATTNEVFILQLIKWIGIGLTLLTLFLGIQNVHFYSFKKTVTSILLTILLIFVIVLVAILFVILTTKLFQFLEILLKEVFR